MSKSLKAAIFCGAAPLVTGLCVYLLWRITGADALMLAGLYTIGIGVLAFLAGITLLAMHHFWPASDAVVRPCQSLTVLAILCLNFPVAAFCVLSANDIYSRYTLTVRNESPVAIESLEVSGPGVSSEIGPVSPGESKCVHFHFVGEGGVTFSARQGEVRFSGTIDGYVTSGVGGACRTVIHAPGKWETVPETQANR